jgi:hypothetical protein
MATKLRDFQRQPFYDFHHKVFRSASGELTKEECTALVEDACRCYGIVAPKMVYPDGYQAKSSAYYPMERAIKLYEWAQRRYIVWHELAHHIDCMTGYSGVGHGPKFVGIFAYLMNQYNGYPLHEIHRKLERHGIKFDKNIPMFVNGNVPNPALVKSYS